MTPWPTRPTLGSALVGSNIPPPVFCLVVPEVLDPGEGAKGSLEGLNRPQLLPGSETGGEVLVHVPTGDPVGFQELPGSKCPDAPAIALGSVDSWPGNQGVRA